jgi:hypothetical protein
MTLMPLSNHRKNKDENTEIERALVLIVSLILNFKFELNLKGGKKMTTNQINSWGLLEWAQFFVSKGFSVIPLMPETKRPAIRWKEFQRRKPTSFELEQWFKHSENNIAIVTGEISGITVVDLDSQRAIDFARDQKFPKTPIVKSSKGAHLYYKYLPGTRNFQKRDELSDIDLRSDGGYIVAPPSIHPSGTPYRWDQGHGLDDLDFAPLPKIFLKNIESPKQSVNDLRNGVQKGNRNNSLARLVGSWIAKGGSYDACLAMAHAWNRNNRPPLNDAEVERTVKSIFTTHEREKVSKPQINDFEVNAKIEDAERIFIFENKDDVKYFEALNISDSCAIYMPLQVDADFEFLSGKDVVIYQRNNESVKKRVKKFAKDINFEVPVKSIKFLQSPVNDSFSHWIELIAPYGSESLDILSDPQIPIRMEGLKQTDDKPIRQYSMPSFRNDPLLNKKMNIELFLDQYSSIMTDGGYIRSVIPSPDVIKNRYDTFEFEKRLKMIMDPWLDEENIVLVSSDAGVGKTWFLLEAANACAKGVAAFNGLWRVESPINVLYVDGEMPPTKWRDRLDLIKAAPNLKYISKMLWEREGLEPPLDIDNTETREYLRHFIVTGKYKLVIFDNIISLFSNYNLRGDEAWGEINSWLLKLRAEKVSVLLAHHNRKGKGKDADQLRSILHVVNIDSFFMLKSKSKPGTEEDMCKFRIQVIKDRERRATGLSKFVFTFDDGIWSVEEEAEAESKAEKFRNKYGDKLPIVCRMFVEGNKQKDIAAAIDVRDSTLSSTIKPWLLGKKDEEAWLIKVDGGYELTEYGKEQANFSV